MAVLTVYIDDNSRYVEGAKKQEKSGFMSIIKRLYDQNYFENVFYKERPKSQRNQRRLQELLTYKASGSLLEIGCGEGNFLKAAEEYFMVQGVDISEYAVNKARQILGKKIVQKDIENTSLPTQHFDAMAAFNVLEHLRKPANVIQKLHLALKDGGVLIGSVPNNFRLVGGTTTLLSNFIDKTHCSTFTPEVWQQHFQTAGFNSIVFFGEITFGRNNCYYIKNKLWKHISFNLMFVCTK